VQNQRLQVVEMGNQPGELGAPGNQRQQAKQENGER
jgi:hypothetical protein